MGNKDSDDGKSILADGLPIYELILKHMYNLIMAELYITVLL